MYTSLLSANWLKYFAFLRQLLSEQIPRDGDSRKVRRAYIGKSERNLKGSFFSFCSSGALSFPYWEPIKHTFKTHFVAFSWQIKVLYYSHSHVRHALSFASIQYFTDLSNLLSFECSNANIVPIVAFLSAHYEKKKIVSKFIRPNDGGRLIVLKVSHIIISNRSLCFSIQVFKEKEKQ